MGEIGNGSTFSKTGNKRQGFESPV
jgi:hypothetical protein